MAVNEQTLEQLVTQARQLPPADRVRLIQQVAETLLAPQQPRTSQGLVYGKYRGPRMSTEEDFKIAEWHPTLEDFDAP